MKNLMEATLTSSATRAGPAGLGHESGAPGQPSSSTRSSLVLKGSSVSKMLATECTYAMLVRCELEGPDSLQDEYVVLSGSALTWNQILSKATGSNILVALQETASVPESTSAFPWRVRLCTTDQAPANVVAERLLHQQRGPGWQRIHLFCKVHHASRCTTKSFALVEEHITGLVNYSLCVAVGFSLSSYRRALQTLIARRLVFIRGSPPADVVAYQQFILKLFGGTGTRLAEKNFLLSTIVNGDWRKPHCGDVAQALTFALSHRSLSTFPRHRWIGW